MLRVVFDGERCKGCGLCIEFCPANIVVMSEQINRAGYKPALVPQDDVESCISCGRCATMCPDNVIEVYRPDKQEEVSGSG